MIHHIKGDLFTTKADVIAHQVNCKGVMGSGVAKQVKQRYSKAFEQYQQLFINANKPYYVLAIFGTTQLVDCNDRIIANMFAQNEYGYDGKRYTDYEAFYKCLEKMDKSLAKDKSVAFPYKIGCDRGGADWNIIYTMIETVMKDREVYIYEL